MIFTAIFPVPPIAPTLVFIGISGQIGDPISDGIIVNGTRGFSPDIPRPAGALIHRWTDPTTSLVIEGDAVAAEAAFLQSQAQQILLASQYVPTNGPQIFIPADNDDEDRCTVFAGVKSPGGPMPANSEIIFDLRPLNSALASGRLIMGRKVIDKANSHGELKVALERNDRMDPEATPTSHWLVNCDALGLKNYVMYLDSPSFNLTAAIRAANGQDESA